MQSPVKQLNDPWGALRISEFRNLMIGRFLFIMGLRMMGGQSVQDAAMATARMPPLPQAPGPITQRITMPNGRSMTCTTTGNNTNCF